VPEAYGRMGQEEILHSADLVSMNTFSEPLK